MSHAVVRGSPYPSQLYLDKILDEIVKQNAAKGVKKERDTICLAEILFYSLKQRPSDVFMINGGTGEHITNEYLLKQSVSIARALASKGLRGKTVAMIMKNHQHMVIMYYAFIFSGVIPFLIDPLATIFELKHFLAITTPEVVYCDQEHYDNLMTAAQEVSGISPSIVVMNSEELLRQYADGASDDVESFKLPESTPDSTVLMVPTSGSTGLPKASILLNRGLVDQLPCPWAHHSKFPKPTDRAMILTTLQWMTFTMLVTSSPVYHVSLLITPKTKTEEHVLEIIDKFKPTWTFFGPAFAKSLAQMARPGQLDSFETLVSLGAPLTPDVIAALKEKLPASCHISDSYGTTETQGYIVSPSRTTPIGSMGQVLNILEYKLVDDDGRQITTLNAKGELYVRSKCFIKGYYRNEAAGKESFTPDGWFKTGDVFHIDDQERLYYVERKKFWFKYNNNNISPEEVEAVISSVPGVKECFVCGTDRGPTAAVVVQPGSDVTKEQILHAVDSTLSDYKRLRGGVVFVKSLLYTHSGKMKRAECLKMVKRLVGEGQG